MIANGRSETQSAAFACNKKGLERCGKSATALEMKEPVARPFSASLSGVRRARCFCLVGVCVLVCVWEFCWFGMFRYVRQTEASLQRRYGCIIVIVYVKALSTRQQSISAVPAI